MKVFAVNVGRWFEASFGVSVVNATRKSELETRVNSVLVVPAEAVAAQPITAAALISGEAQPLGPSSPDWGSSGYPEPFKADPCSRQDEEKVATAA